MKRLFSVSVLLLSLLAAPGLIAKETVVGMSKKTYDAINEIQPLIDAENWSAAVTELEELRERKLNGYETAHVLNMLGYAWFQLDDNNKALACYEEALQQNGLPPSQIRALLTTASQVSLASENYKDAEAYALRLLAAEEEAPQPMSQIILAQAYVGQERYDLAVAPLKKAIQMLVDRGSKPRENWMLMLSSVYYYLEDYDAMRDVLYELVTLYPAERYLINLAALHGQLGDTDKQMALVESLLDDQRLKNGYHMLSLANLFLAHGMPYKAASLLETEMESGRIESTRQNLELQSQAWYMAGEEANAIPPLAEAAALAETGELYLRVARLYMDTYQWQAAERAARKAIDKGELRDEGSAWLLVGMALSRGDKLDAARTAFVAAAEHEKSREWARQWIRFVDNEQARFAAMNLSP
ncbi:MAG: tetratricopeptide repeat protein [Halieaceae bacterium]